MPDSTDLSDEDVKLAALKIAVSASLSLAVMMADYTWLIRDERRVIWRRLRFWYSRIYLFSRYIGLASQIFNVYFTVRMYIGIGTTPTWCKLWFAYQAVVVQILLASLEGVLMHRVYVLFERKLYILMILVLLTVGQIASMVITIQEMPFLGDVDSMVDGDALMTEGRATTMTTSVVIISMTYSRFHRLSVKWTRRGIARMVICDTSLSLLTLFGLMLFLTLCSLEVIRPSIGGNITYYWLVCLLWISIGRIIVNQEILAEAEERRSTIQFTSHIEIEAL